MIWLVILLSATWSTAATWDVHDLGKKPVCEASAIALQPCGDGGGRCVLVADNEQKKALYRFMIEGETLTNQEEVRLEGAGTSKHASIKDAEGLALLGSQVIVLGSHSRRAAENGCTPDEARLVYAVLDRTPDGRYAVSGDAVVTPPDDWQKALADGGSCFMIPSLAQSTRGAAACRAMIAGNAHAEEPGRCGDAVNFEGVAVLPDSSRVWVGLRGPTVEGKAVLLRLADLKTFTFDALATADLHGDGVRDLFADGTWLWILAGPSADLWENGSLWRVPLADVVDGAALRPTRVVAGLPPFSEGFAIDPETHGAFVVVDGDEGDGPACKVPARYLYLAPSLLD